MRSGPHSAWGRALGRPRFRICELGEMMFLLWLLQGTRAPAPSHRVLVGLHQRGPQVVHRSPGQQSSEARCLVAGWSPSHPQEGPAGDSPLQEADPDAFCSSHLSDSAADKEQSGGVVRESSVATCLHVSRAESGRPEEAVGRVAEEAWVPECSVGSEDQALGPGGASTSSSHPPKD